MPVNVVTFYLNYLLIFNVLQQCFNFLVHCVSYKAVICIAVVNNYGQVYILLKNKFYTKTWLRT